MVVFSLQTIRVQLYINAHMSTLLKLMAWSQRSQFSGEQVRCCQNNFEPKNNMEKSERFEGKKEAQRKIVKRRNCKWNYCLLKVYICWHKKTEGYRLLSENCRSSFSRHLALIFTSSLSLLRVTLAKGELNFTLH